MAIPTGYQPVIYDRYLHVSQLGYSAVEKRIRGRYGMAPKIIVIHIQEGTNLGSWQWFHVVQASSTVLIGKNGDIWRLVPEADGPWCNGDVQNPDAFARQIMNKWGPDPNAYTLSIETEGYTGEFPKPDAQMHAVEWQVRDWESRYDIDAIYVIKHGQINSVSRARCPGDAYFAALQEALRDEPVTPKPVYAPGNALKDAKGVAWDGSKDLTIGDRKFYGLGTPLKVHAAVDGVQPHVYATRTSAFTRSALNKGDEFTVIGWCHGEEINGDDRWWITKAFSRIDVNGTVEKPPSASEQPQPDKPEGTVIINGRIYFPAQRGDAPTRKLRVRKKANLRSAASLKSKVVGTVAKNDIIEVAYWCFGGEVNDHRSWWILKPADGSDAIKHGARLWSDATEAYPEDDAVNE